MKINGIMIINFKICDGLYNCDVILDKHFLGRYSQKNSYADEYTFDKALLEQSAEAFKKSALYKASYFKTDSDIKDFYTVDMFMNDICDLYLDEQISKQLFDKGYGYSVIGESYITNETAYAGANNQSEIDDIKSLLKKQFKNSVNIRIYDNINDFIIDTRGG